MPDTNASTEVDIIGSADVCAILGGISRATLTRWVADGRVPVVAKFPRKNGAFAFDRAAIEALASELAGAA